MRILLLSQFYPPVIGGEERHVHSLAHALDARGHDVAVATQSEPDAKIDEAQRIRVYPLHGTVQRLTRVYVDNQRPHAPPFPDPELALALRRAVRAHRPDVVHAHNWIFYSYLPLRPFWGAPLVVTLHDYGLVCPRKNLTFNEGLCSGPAPAKCYGCAIGHYGAAKGAVTLASHMAMRPLVSRAVDRYLAVSTAVARDNRLAGTPHEVIPNFIPDRFAEASEGPNTSLLPDEPFILFVGDLSPHKGLHVLLDAYRSLGGESPPLVLIGRRTPETPGNLPDKALLFESWAHADVLAAWRRCLFGLAPSIWREPCATVLMEGMSFGKPMIATRLGGNTDIVEHESSGLLVAPGDAAELAAAIRNLIHDRSLRERLGGGATLRIGQFRSSAVVSRIERIYADVLASRGSVAAA